MPDPHSPESEVLIARAVPGEAPQVLIARHRQERSEADLALTLASLSWVIGPVVLSLPGLLLARREIAAIRAGRRSDRNLKKARNAFWMSLLNLIVAFVFLAVSVDLLRGI